jgi:sialate O-acetylesterase
MVVGLAAGFAMGEVAVDKMFSDHMVLQRDMAVPVWGTAGPGEKVTVAFRDQTKSAEAGKDGKWVVRLDAMKVGEPGKMTVSGGAAPIVFDDVVVGEVWLGSGQSNMAGGTGGFSKNDPVLTAMAAGGPYPKLRLYRGGWQHAESGNIAGFSALLFSFGMPLQKALDVPVGLVVGAVGGTPSGRWLSPEMLADDEACQALLKKAGVDSSPQQAEKYKQALAEWEKAAKAAKDQGKKAPARPRGPVQVGDLYAAHVKPIVPYAIRGVLWDQGESGTAVAAIDQFTMMGALIKGWRKVWGQGEFPFLYIQKPSGGSCAWDVNDPVTCKAEKFAPQPDKPNAANAGDYRALHISIMRHPNTAMVSAGDLGPGIHPTNKSGYGTRACRVALGFVYGKEVEYYGPIYDSHSVEGKAIRVKFTHAAGLAVPPGQKLQGFEIAGADGAYQWAEAKIEPSTGSGQAGDTVVVSSDKVPAPVSVRYAWAQSHPWANLFNSAHLPALTFRTDSPGK